MRAGVLLTFAFVVAASSAMAQTPPAYPPGAEAREARLLAKIGPQTRNWIGQEARREAAAGNISEQTATGAVRGNFATLGNMSGADIEALAFIVMMEASKSAQEDLKSIMDGVKAINNAKQAQRTRLSTASKLAAANANPPPPPPRRIAINRAAIQPHPIPKAELDAKVDQLKNDKDGLDELGEMEQLRLQMVMDRQSKFMETISNIMKKMSDTDSAIIQNLK